jgi:hypothetical protein
VAASYYADIAAQQKIVMERQWQAMRETLSEIVKQTPAILKSGDAAKDSVDESRKSRMSAERQSNAALDAGIEAAHNDQRPWVAISGFETKFEETVPKGGGIERRERVSATIRNSGRTPALSLTAWLIVTGLPIGQPVPTYEEQTNLLRKNGGPQEFNFFGIITIKRGRYEKLKIPIALPPDAPVKVMLWDALGSPPEKVGPFVKRNQSVTYILGRITYSDIFSSSRTHETSYCLMNDPETGIYEACPIGYQMN